MNYIHLLPKTASFTTKVTSGYTFGPLNRKDLKYYIDVNQGHDAFFVSKKIRGLYYILAGSGYFTIANRKFEVSAGLLVEVPRNVEYSHSGKMKRL